LFLHRLKFEISRAACLGRPVLFAAAGQKIWRGLNSVALSRAKNFVFLLLVAGVPLGLRAEDVTALEKEFLSNDASLWTESMLWDREVDVRTGVGYKDNVLLSPFTPHGSGFFSSGLDLSLIRLPLDSWQVVLMLSGDDRRYWNDAGASGEDTALVSLSVERRFANHWRLGMKTLYVYENEVLDISTLQGGPRTALVEGHGLTAQPSLRYETSGSWFFQLETPVTRWYFRSPLDDDWEYGPVVSAGFDYGRDSRISLLGGVNYQSHDQNTALDTSGNPVAGKLEMLQQCKVELAWRHHWDKPKHWRSVTRLTFEDVTDNDSGYFNYRKYCAAEELRWRSGGWEIKGTGSAAYYDYPVQTVSLGTAGSPDLQRTLVDVSIQIERRLIKELKSYLRFEYERALSNQDSSRYAAKTVAGGLEWSF